MSDVGRHMRALAVVVFIASLGVNWPSLPLNIRLPDLVFIPLAALLLAAPARARWSLGLLDLLVVAYLAGGLPSLIVTTDLRSSLIELVKHGYVAAIYAAMAVAVQRGHLESIMAGMAAGGISLAILGVVFAAAHAFLPFDLPSIGGVLTLPYVGPVLRLRALTATPAMLACVLTMAVPFAITGAIRAQDSRRRLIWVGAIGLIFAAAVMTFSHVLGGFLVAALVAGWPVLQHRPAWRRVGVLATIAIATMCNLSVVASVRQVTFANTVLADRTDYIYAVDEGRLRVGPAQIVYEVMSYFRIKEIAWEAFREHPLAGVGLDRFHEVSERAYQNGRLTERYRAIDPHSSMLGRLAETGLAGGLTLALLWVGLAKTGARALRGTGRDTWPARAAFAGLLGLLIAGVNVDIMNFRFFWAGLGLLRGWMSTPARTS